MLQTARQHLRRPVAGSRVRPSSSPAAGLAPRPAWPAIAFSATPMPPVSSAARGSSRSRRYLAVRSSLPRTKRRVRLRGRRRIRSAQLSALGRTGDVGGARRARRVHRRRSAGRGGAPALLCNGRRAMHHLSRSRRKSERALPGRCALAMNLARHMSTRYAEMSAALEE